MFIHQLDNPPSPDKLEKIRQTLGVFKTTMSDLIASLIKLLKRILPEWLLDNWQIWGFLRAPLKTRFIKGLGLMMLPLLILGSVSFFVVKDLDETFHDMIEEILVERELLLQVQLHVVQTRSLAYRCQSPSDENPLHLAPLLISIDRQIKKIPIDVFGLEEETSLLVEAFDEWRRIHVIGLAIVSTQESSGTIDQERLALFLAGLDNINENISTVHELASEEIDEDIAEFEKSRHNLIYMILISFTLGLFIIFGTGVLLAGSILSPVHKLQIAAEAIREGDFSPRPKSRQRDELAYLMQTFNLMAENIEQSHQKLTELASHDALTGLLNRREMIRILPTEIERARRYKRSVGLLVLDIDFFKKVNDTYGHTGGDIALSSVAESLRSFVRQVDFIFRYGGEEFVLLLPDTDHVNSCQSAQRLRKMIEETPITINEQEINITVSIGVATYPLDAIDGDILFDRADAALYRAKQTGRNRVCCH